MDSSIFAGFLKYPKTDRQTPLENQTTELLAAILRRSDDLCREFVLFLCQEAERSDLDDNSLREVDFKVATQELARWNAGTGYMDLVVRGYKEDRPFVYVCVEVKVEAELHMVNVEISNSTDSESENIVEAIKPQVNGYEEHIHRNETADHTLVGVLAKRRSKWEPKYPYVAFDAIWLNWALRLRSFLRKGSDPVSQFLARQFLVYMKEGGITVAGPFTLSEFGGVRDFLSFWEKLNLALEPIQRLKLPNRQVIRILDESGIHFRTDIHWQMLKAGIRFKEETSELPEFYLELELGAGKRNKLDEVSQLGKAFAERHETWMSVQGEMTYLKKSAFEPAWLTEDDNIHQIRAWISEAIGQIESGDFGFLDRFMKIVD